MPLRRASLWPRRAILLSLSPVRNVLELRDFLLSRIDLLVSMLSVLLPPTVGLRVADFREAEIDGVLVVTDAGFRDVRPCDLPMIDTLPELAAGCFAPVPIELPMRDLDALVLEPDRLGELTAGCLAAEEADGLYMRIVLLLRDVLPELPVDRLEDEETDGLLVVIELPILDLVLVVGCLVEEETGGLVIVIDLPMRVLLLGLRGILELRLIEVEPVELRLIEVLEEGVREIEEPGRLEIVIRLDVDLLGLLLEDIVPDRLGADRPTVILLEPLRLDSDRLDEIELGRLGEDLLTVILLELLRLGIERLDEIEPERPGIDLLTDTLLELLRLGVDRLELIVLERIGLGALLTDVRLELLRLEIDRLELRLADIELERLGVGRLTDVRLELLLLGEDRLTDDLLELLRVGVGARLGAEDFAA